MSIKTLNVDYSLLPTPPVGYTYIFVGIDGVMGLKLDDGSVIFPSGFDKLSNLTDVSISGVTSGQLLSWNGTKWVNTDSVIDLSGYWNSGQTSAAISSAISTEVSDRSSVDTVLSSSISSEISTRESADSSILSYLDNKPIYLSNISDINLSGLTNNDTLVYNTTSNKWENSHPVDITNNMTEGNIVIYTSNVLSGTTNLFPSVSTAISSEIVTRGSVDSSISTVLSTEISNITSNNTSLSTAISGEIMTRGSVDSSISTVLSTETSTRISVDSSISTVLSTETSTRISVDSSISTVLSTEMSTRTSVDESLSTAISGETSTRISQVSSLSSAISSSVGNVTFTGGTVNWLNVTGDFTASGLTHELKKENYVTYFSQLKTDYAGFPNSWGLTLSSFKNGIILQHQSNANFTAYYRNTNQLEYYGNGYFSSNTGMMMVDDNLNRITKVTNGRLDWVGLNSNGWIDKTTYSGYTRGNSNFYESNTDYSLNYIPTNDYSPRHKDINNKTYARDINGRLLRMYWNSSTNFRIEQLSTLVGSFSVYMSGKTEVVRAIGSGLTMDIYNDGVLQSSSALTSNWIAAGHSPTFSRTLLLEENSSYILFAYMNGGTTMCITIYDKLLNNFSYKTMYVIDDSNRNNCESSVLINNNLFYWFNTSLYRYYFDPVTKNITTTVFFDKLTLEADLIYANDAIYASSGPYAEDTTILKKILIPSVSQTSGSSYLDSRLLTNYQDLQSTRDYLDLAITNVNTQLTTSLNLIKPYTIIHPTTSSSISYCRWDEGFEFKISSADSLKDLSNNNINTFSTKYFSDLMLVKHKIYGQQTLNSNYNSMKSINLSGITCYNTLDNTFNFIKTGITFTNVTFNKRDNLISYADTTNNLLEIYNCNTESILKSIAYSTNMWIFALNEYEYVVKTTGSTIELRRMSDDAILKNTTYSGTWETADITFSPENCSYYAANSTDVQTAYVCRNLRTGIQTNMATTSSYVGIFSTEKYTFFYQGSNAVNIKIFDKQNNTVDTINNAGGRYNSMSNGKKFFFLNTSNGNNMSIIY